MSLKELIADELDHLTPQQQQEILAHVKRLGGSKPLGTPGAVLLAHMNDFQFEPGRLMK